MFRFSQLEINWSDFGIEKLIILQLLTSLQLWVELRRWNHFKDHPSKWCFCWIKDEQTRHIQVARFEWHLHINWLNLCLPAVIQCIVPASRSLVVHFAKLQANWELERWRNTQLKHYIAILGRMWMFYSVIDNQWVALTLSSAVELALWSEIFLKQGPRQHSKKFAQCYNLNRAKDWNFLALSLKKSEHLHVKCS